MWIIIVNVIRIEFSITFYKRKVRTILMISSKEENFMSDHDGYK